MAAARPFSPAQCRAARGLLNWSRQTLARRAGIELEAIELFEGVEGELGEGDSRRLARAFNAAGVIPIQACSAGEGVRFRNSIFARRTAFRRPVGEDAGGFPHGV